MASEMNFVPEMPDKPGTDLIIEHQERRFIQRHQRVVKKVRPMPNPEELQEPPPHESENKDEEQQLGRIMLFHTHWISGRWQREQQQHAPKSPEESIMSSNV